ncbi:calcium/sodium antiporter [Pseudoalteromonas sp. McH1-7]|nr:calcium/sodium antiporter [Pseudoalteromonas sp. McH1-7]
MNFRALDTNRESQSNELFCSSRVTNLTLSLVAGASKLAASFNVPSVLIGLTIVSFGTSAPELTVSIQSAVTGQGSLAFANVLGSNTFNILFILGVSALIAPLVVSQELVKRDIPMLVIASFIVTALVWDGRLSQLDAALLCSLLLFYVAYLSIQGRMLSNKNNEPTPSQQPNRWRERAVSILLFIVGLSLLIFGGQLMVENAVQLARALAVDEVMIGLTIIAIGTSLPEVVTSVMASIKGHADIAVGNVIGSNLFNSLGVLGVTGLISATPLEVTSRMLNVDISVMIVATILCTPLLISGLILSRKEGGILFIGYVAYFVYTLI